MRLVPGLKLRKIGRKYIIVAPVSLSSGSGDTEVFTLNESAAYLWERAVGQEFSTADMVSWLCEAYKIPEDVAAGDVAKTVSVWQDYGLIASDNPSAV